MSAGVYNIPAIQPHLRFGHNFAYSFSPHTALLLATIGEKGLCWFSDELIIHYQGPAEWSDLNVLLGKMTLLELVSDANIRRKLATKLSLKPSLEAVAVQLTKFCLTNRNRDESLFQYDQICSRLYYYDRPFLARLRIAAYRLMVRWPSLGYLGVKTFFPLVKKIAGYQHVDLDQYVSSDRFMRV